MQLEKFKEIAKDLFGIKVKDESDEYIIFEILGMDNGGQSKWFESRLSKQVFQSIFDELNGYEYSKTIISNDKSFECLIKYNEFNPFLDKIEKEIEDQTNDLKYKIGKPSIGLLLNVLKSLHDKSGKSAFNYFFKNDKKNSEYFLLNENNQNTIELIRTLCEDFQSITVSSNDNIELNRFKDLSNSFLFELGYSFSFSISLVEKSINDVFWTTKHRGKIRMTLDQIYPPEKIFDKNLLNYYQRAISTNVIEYQYISFYHIIEYFYDKVFTEELILPVKNMVNSSDFNLNDSERIAGLINLIISDYSKLNETNALRKTLSKYINPISEIVNELNTYDTSLIVYCPLINANLKKV